MRRDRPSNPCGRTRSMMNKIALLGAVNQAFVLQSRDRSLQTAPSGQVMLVSDRCYCIHQPETEIASLQRVLDKMRSLLSLLKREGAIKEQAFQAVNE